MSSSGVKQDWHCLATGKIAPVGPTGAQETHPWGMWEWKSFSCKNIQINWIGPQTSHFICLTLRGMILFASCFSTLLSSRMSHKRSKQLGLEHLLSPLSEDSHEDSHTYAQQCTRSDVHAHAVWAAFLFHWSALSRRNCLHIRGNQPSCMSGSEWGQTLLGSEILCNHLWWKPNSISWSFSIAQTVPGGKVQHSVDNMLCQSHKVGKGVCWGITLHLWQLVVLVC